MKGLSHARPCLLIAGPPGSGQTSVASALLHVLERLPTHSLGLPSLLASSSAR